MRLVAGGAAIALLCTMTGPAAPAQRSWPELLELLHVTQWSLLS